MNEFIRRRIAQIVEKQDPTLTIRIDMPMQDVLGKTKLELVEWLKANKPEFRFAGVEPVEIAAAFNRNGVHMVTVKFLADFSYLINDYNLRIFVRDVGNVVK